jgi:GT2 family glycosyltransferase
MNISRPHISIILVNFNGWKDTIDCIKSLYKQTYNAFNLILVENGSTNESYHELSKWFNSDGNDFLELELKENKTFDNDIVSGRTQNFFIKSKTNYGFAGGNNIGISLAEMTNSDFVMLLNNDTIVELNFLERLIDFKNKNPEYVAMTPQIRLFEPSNKIWNCGGKLYFPLYRKYYYAGQDKENVPQKGFHDITYVTGCALFFDHRITGYLTENFFFGEEDIEFSKRAKDNRWKMACVFDSIIYHKVNGSIVLNKTSLNKVRLYYTNRFINLKNHYSWLMRSLAMMAFSIYGTLMLVRKQNVNPFNCIKLFRKVIADTKRLDRVDKQTFERILFKEDPF